MARMQVASGLLLLLLLGVGVVSAWSHVSSEELKGVVERGSQVLIAFVKPEEPASAALEEEWLSAAAATAAIVAAATAANQTQTQLLTVDCSLPDNNDCALQQHMPAYPSIFLLRRDEPAVEYHGPRRGDALLSFLSRRTRTPTVADIPDAAALAALKRADETVFVAYLNLDADRGLAGVFEDVARGLRDEFSFGMVGGEEVARGEGVKTPAVVCYNKEGGGDGVVLEGPFEAGGLRKWVGEASRDVIGELTVFGWKRLVEDGRPIVYLFGATASERQALREACYKLAQRHYASLAWVVVDPFQFPDLMGKLRLEPDVFPTGAVHQPSKDLVYPYPEGQDLTPDSVQKWILGVQQDRIQAWKPPVKGEPTGHDEL